MSDRPRMILRISSACVVFAGYMALATVREYGAVLLLPPAFFLLFSPLGEYLERRQAWFRSLKLAACVGYGVFIPVSVIQMGLMNAVICLVIFIQGYLLLGVKSEKVHLQLYLMAFFLLLAAVVQSPEPAIALVLGLFITASIWAFVSLRIHSDMSGADRLRAVRVPGGRLRGEARPGNVFDGGLFVSVWGLAFAAMAFTILLFLATPRIEAGFLGRADPTRAVTGLSETVRLTGGLSVYEDPSAVMNVAFPDEPEGLFVPADGMYWRATTLSRFAGSEWSRRGLESALQPGAEKHTATRSVVNFKTAGREEARDRVSGRRVVRQVIFMDSVPTGSLPCLDLVQRAALPPSAERATLQWDTGLDFTVQLNRNTGGSISYEAWSEVAEPRAAEARASSDDYSFVPPRDYGLLTYHELLPETVRTAERVAGGQGTPHAKMRALEQWLSGPDFTYTLDLPPLPPDREIDAFINEARRGHCQLFASALALMARSQGIPARVVSGYRGGEWDPGSRSYTVRASMSHLWVEALIPGAGWVRFDPSPASEFSATGFGRLRREWSSRVLGAKMFWYRKVMGFEGTWRLDQLAARFRNPGHGAPGRRFALPEVFVQAGGLGGLSRVSWAAGGAVLLSVAAVLLRVLLRGRGRGPRLSPDQARAARLHRRLCRRLERLGVACAGKTCDEIRVALAAAPELRSLELRAFLDTYEDVRFGGRPLAEESHRDMTRLLGRIPKRRAGRGQGAARA